MLPPEPDELMLLIYSFEGLNTSEEMGKRKGGSNRPEGCPHTATLPLTHGADCEVHCFVCMPKLRERLFPRGVSYLPRANSQPEPSHGLHALSPSRPVAEHDGHSRQSIMPIAV